MLATSIQGIEITVIVEVAHGDLDGDGDLDLVVHSGTAFNIWLNDGDVSFTRHAFIDQLDGPGHVELADLDGDGDLDAFVAIGSYSSDNEFSEANRVWLNDGAGNLTDSGQRLGLANSHGVALADLDGDGDADAFVTNQGGPDQVWRNDGAGNFSKIGPPLGSEVGQKVALGDLDGDGLLDAFVANLEGPNRIWNGIDIRDVPDLAITKSAGQVAIEPGSRITYTIEVSNIGDVPVEGATVVDTFDSHLENIRLDSLSGTGGAESALIPEVIEGGLIDSVNLPAGATIVYTVSASMAVHRTNFAPESIITNSARVMLPDGLPTVTTKSGSKRIKIAIAVQVTQLHVGSPPRGVVGHLDKVACSVIHPHHIQAVVAVEDIGVAVAIQVAHGKR